MCNSINKKKSQTILLNINFKLNQKINLLKSLLISGIWFFDNNYRQSGIWLWIPNKSIIPVKIDLLKPQGIWIYFQGSEKNESNWIWIPSNFIPEMPWLNNNLKSYKPEYRELTIGK